ncbi:MAG TPA: nitrate reductase associated protein [Chryseolinea sp.]|nr:nitrate reductase associated protein [Chryseolinea sp.]
MNHEKPCVSLVGGGPGAAPEYFQFEEDFVEDNIRCIPMIVRFKLDACCIKLKLREWSQLRPAEREALATMACENDWEVQRYRHYLEGLVWRRTGQTATSLAPVVDAPWTYGKEVPEIVRTRLDETGRRISFLQWNGLRVLQRFALIKLSASGHEHKNFSKALEEFNLSQTLID